jgi:hypothetical protein
LPGSSSTPSSGPSSQPSNDRFRKSRAQSGFAEVGCPKAQQRFDRPRATSTQSGLAEVGCPEAQRRTRGCNLNKFGRFGSRLSKIVLAHSSSQMTPTRHSSEPHDCRIPRMKQEFAFRTGSVKLGSRRSKISFGRSSSQMMPTRSPIASNEQDVAFRMRLVMFGSRFAKIVLSAPVLR